MNVAGTDRVARQAAAAGVTNFIQISSSTAAPDSLSAYGRTKYAGEEAVRRVPGLRFVILRPNLIVGAGGGGVYGRMAGLVRGLPMIPLLGGGHSILQPIHVDDLCEAIFTSIERIADLNGSVLNLGHAEGMELRAFLALVSRHETGRAKTMVGVPLWPVQVAVGAAEAIGLKLPVSSSNLQGLRQIRKVETAADLARLDLTLRPVGDIGGGPVPVEPAAGGYRPARILLVGGGRIGLIHGINLSRLSGIVLAGIVDPSPKAIALLRGMGITPPSWKTLDQAFATAAFDGAIIATPPSTHLPLAEVCLARGLAVMVEKPLAPDPARDDAFLALDRKYPGKIMGGYVIPRTPHIGWWAARLRRGDLGSVTGFHGHSLLSFMLVKGMKTWQANPAVSGGGVLMNPGVHVLSMLWTACGAPAGIGRAESVRIHSRSVEDSLAVELEYPTFKGTIHTSWSIEGFARPEHQLTIRTDRGSLTLTGSAGIFVPRHGPVEFRHQIDTPTPFNLAPDFAGAGFAAELEELGRRGVGAEPESTGLDVHATADLERTVFQIYARTVPDRPMTIAGPAADPPSSTGGGARVWIDLRDLSQEAARSAAGSDAWAGFEISSAHARAWRGAWPAPGRIRVTVPDFLDHSRLLLSGRALTLVRRLGVGGVTAAALGAIGPVVRDRGASFWAAASGLLAADLSATPSEFNGTLFLHPALVDLALALRRYDRLGEWLAALRAARPDARTGFHTQLPREAAAALPLLGIRPDDISCVLTPGRPGREDLIRRLRGEAGAALIRITIEPGATPAAVHRWAAREPEPWTTDADGLLVHASADAACSAALRLDLAPRWAAAFPGIPAPDLWG